MAGVLRGVAAALDTRPPNALGTDWGSGNRGLRVAPGWGRCQTAWVTSSAQSPSRTSGRLPKNHVPVTSASSIAGTTLRERRLPIPWNPAINLGRPGEYVIRRGLWRPRPHDKPYLFAFQGWTLARASRPARALSDPPDELWRTMASVYLTTRRRLVTVVELGREQPPNAVRPLVLTAELHAGWGGARSWLRSGARLLPCLDHVPDLRESLEGALSDAVERVEQSIREAGWERDYS